MAIPKEPRQLMINLMYLVLTALLALNVSAEVLNAFGLVSQGMETSNNALDGKNNDLIEEFNKQNQINPTKTAKSFQDAKQANLYYADFDNYVDALIERVVTASGGWIEDDDGNTTGELKEKKNYDSPTNVLIGDGEGAKLKAEIENLKVKLLALKSLTPEDVTALSSQFTLSTEYDIVAAKKLNKKTWEAYLFDHVPVIAVQTLLTKIKGDGKASYGLVVERLLSKIGKEDYKFDELRSLVIPNSNYILSGQDYKADIFVSAFSSTQKPKVFYGTFKPDVIKTLYGEDGNLIGEKIPDNPLQPGYEEVVEVVSGMGKYSTKTNRTGEFELTGVIQVQKPNVQGAFDYYPFDLSYQVAKGGVVVSPDKMNVMYIGVDNPMSVSVAGFPADKVSASGSQGKMSKTKKGYNARVNKVGKNIITVFAKMEDGKKKKMGAVEFRVKRVPDPIAKIGGSKGGSIKSSTFKVQRGIIADLENFDFDVRFKIKSFSMTYAAKRQDLVDSKASGPLFNSKMLDFLKRGKPGDVFYFDDIRAIGPDGTTRKLASIVFKLI